ncbi:MAG: response regulator [Elusimicrobia bacterium]|nr:response regulator [Elusimicrobiota bacterium]
MSAAGLLVIDDEPVICEAVAKICGAEGLPVDAADGGAAALTLLQGREYRLILCDLMMNGMDGFQFLAEASRRGVAAPVVMMTGYVTLDNAVRSLACGAADFFAKPFTADELLAVVRRGLKYRELLERAGAGPRLGAAGSRGAGAPAPAAPPAYVPCPPSRRRLGYMSWASVEAAGTGLVGVTDLFVKTLGGVKAVDLSAASRELVQGERCAWLLAADGSRHAALSPLSGRITEANPALSLEPALLEKDPYFGGWLYRIVPSDAGRELENLVSCSSDRI